MATTAPVTVLIYDQSSASASLDRLKDIKGQPTRTCETRGTVFVSFDFTLQELFRSKNRAITKKLRDVVDASELQALAVHHSKPGVPGYVMEMTAKGHFNDSPVTLMAGCSDMTRASFDVVRKLSPDAQLPADLVKKIDSDELLLTTLCPPLREFAEGGPLSRAIEHARREHGVHLYVSSEDGSIMAQNPKAAYIIDECIGVTKESLENSFIKDAHKPVIHTSGRSLISGIVRSCPSSRVRLVWKDVEPFDVSREVFFCIPGNVANWAIHFLKQRKSIVSKLCTTVGDIDFTIQASPMHGNWVFDDETSEYVNRDNGRRCSATTPFRFHAKLHLVVRYGSSPRGSCALARDPEFYPMPVWPQSGIVNGKPRDDKVKPYPGALYTSVMERVEASGEPMDRKRRAATESCLGEAASSTSVADDDQ